MKRIVLRLLKISPLLIWLVVMSGCQQGDKPVVDRKDAPVYAQGDTILIAGILLDTRCFAANRKNYGMDHPDPVPTSQEGAACARYCALQGFPVGLATDGRDGPVWMLLSTPPVLADYMAQYVRIRGVVRSEGVLIPERIEMKSGDEWKFVM